MNMSERQTCQVPKSQKSILIPREGGRGERERGAGRGESRKGRELKWKGKGRSERRREIERGGGRGQRKRDRGESNSCILTAMSLLRGCPTWKLDHAAGVTPLYKQWSAA